MFGYGLVMGRRKTTDEFIASAKAQHGARYDYSKVVYESSKKKITISCKLHGDFLQEAQSHLAGVGCPKCGHAKESARRTISTAEFILRSKRVHGDRYDYSEANYLGSKSKVTLRCFEHGVFHQYAGNHLRGMGCGECAKAARAARRRTPLEEFIKRASKVHDNVYDYSQVRYKGSGIKVRICCPIHGQFFQRPYSHLSGGGCPLCAIEKNAAGRRLTTQGFILRAKEIHGDKFDYSQTTYKTANAFVSIECPIHGIFQQLAASHLKGMGCKKCADEENGRKRLRSFAQFVKEARAIHGHLYEYPDQIYEGGKAKVEIICGIHGPFSQRGEVHLAGGRCVKCADIAIGLAQRMTLKQFIKSATLLHQSKYSYERTHYELSNKHVEIKCPYHGTFQQTPSQHLSGRGCPRCADEIRNLGDTAANIRSEGRKIDGSLYVVEMFDEDEQFFKVGITGQPLEKRLQYFLPLYDLELINSIQLDLVDAYMHEQATLKLLAANAYRPKMYFGGATECLSVNPLEHDPNLSDLFSRYSTNTANLDRRES